MTLRELDEAAKAEQEVLENLKKEMMATQARRKTAISRASETSQANADRNRKRRSVQTHKSRAGSVQREPISRRQSSQQSLAAITSELAIANSLSEAYHEEVVQAPIITEEIVKEAQTELKRAFIEYEDVRTQILSELDIQKELKMKLDLLKNRKRVLHHESRALHSLLGKQQDKVHGVLQWLMSDAFVSFEREKDRANSLIEQVNRLLARNREIRASLKKTLSKVEHKNKNFKKVIREDKAKFLSLQTEIIAIETSNSDCVDEMEKLRAENERMMAIKLRIIEGRISEERESREQELAALKAAIRRATGDEDCDLADLDELDFGESQLGKVRYCVKTYEKRFRRF